MNSASDEKCKSCASSVEPNSPTASVGLVLCGLFLIFGSAYQVIYEEWFPLFPPQLDGAFFIFKSLGGFNVGIYVSSFLGCLLGAFFLWFGAIGFGQKDG